MTMDCTVTVQPDSRMGCHIPQHRANRVDYSHMPENRSVETWDQVIVAVALLEGARTATDLEEIRPGSGYMAGMGSAAFAPEWAAPCVSTTS
jgi:predicted nucleic acid-binding protein